MKESSMSRQEGRMIVAASHQSSTAFKNFEV